MKIRPRAAEALLFLTAALWGFAFVAQRVGMEYLGPLTYNGVRFLLGSFSLLPLILFRRRLRSTRLGSVPHRGLLISRELVVACIIGGLILTVAANLQQWSLQFITAGKAGFITGLYVVLVPIAGAALGRKTPLQAWIGCGVAVIGLYLLSVMGGFRIDRGDLIVLSSTVFWTAHILFLDFFAKRVDPVELSAGQFFVCGFLTLTGAFLFEVPRWTAVVSALVPILYGGLLSIGVAYTLQAVAQRTAHPVRASLIMSLEAVFAALGGALILGERLNLRELAGCALMLAGMMIAQAPSRSETNAPT